MRELVKTWLNKLCDEEIKEVVGSIENERVADLGGSPFAGANIAEMDEYLQCLYMIKNAVESDTFYERMLAD